MDKQNRAMAMYRVTYTIASKTQLSVSRKKKENRKKATKRKTNAKELWKRRSMCYISVDIRGNPCCQWLQTWYLWVPTRSYWRRKSLNIYFTNLLFALSTCKQMFYWESQGPRSQLLLLIRPQIALFSNVCFACLWCMPNYIYVVTCLFLNFKEAFIQAIQFADYAPFQSFYYYRF